MYLKINIHHSIFRRGLFKNADCSLRGTALSAKDTGMWDIRFPTGREFQRYFTLFPKQICRKNLLKSTDAKRQKQVLPVISSAGAGRQTQTKRFMKTVSLPKTPLTVAKAPPVEQPVHERPVHEQSSPSPLSQMSEIQVTDIVPNPANPRRYFDDEEISIGIAVEISRLEPEIQTTLFKDRLDTFVNRKSLPLKVFFE
jgi:hypothetical protein